MIKVRNGTPCKSDFYTANVNAVLDYGDKRGIIAVSFLKWMYWNSTLGKWMVPNDLYGSKCKEIDEYLTDLNNDKGIPYRVIKFECDGYVDDGETDHPSASTGKGDAVNHPPHYNMGGIEVIDAINAWGFAEGFNRGNAIKYVARAGRKNKETEIEDLKKAMTYLQFEIDRLGGGK